MKKVIKVVCMCLALSMLLSMFLGNMPIGEVPDDYWGCSKTKLYEYGDFIITEKNQLYDISDSGLQKEYLIIPERINGQAVSVFVHPPMSFGGASNTAVFRYSEKIKKIYNAENLPTESLRRCRDKVYTSIMYNNQHKKISTPKGKCFNLTRRIGRGDYNREKAVKEFYEGSDPIAYKDIDECVYISLLDKYCFDRGDSFGTSYLIANIEFLYNYENAPNYGCYWIDDLETGETLTYIPENPTRDGYTFGGWYADSECTIEYDFTTPYIKKDLIEMETEDYYYLLYPKDYVTHIYAKWIEN